MSEGYRRAALCIHGLNEPDRTWMLGKLPVTARARIQECLLELQDMNLPAGSQIANTLTSPVLQSSQDERSNQEYQNTRVDDPTVLLASPDLIIDTLRSEPDWVVALVLASGTWPWVPSLINELCVAQRGTEVRRLVGIVRQPMAPLLLAAVQQALADQLLPPPVNNAHDSGVINQFENYYQEVSERLALASGTSQRESPLC